MDIHTLDIIDLISERHTQLRNMLEDAWNEQSDMVLSNTEWHILSKIAGGMNVISDITKSVHITRQATHKHIQNLVSKQLVETYQDMANKRNKCVEITAEGRALLANYNTLKQELGEKLRAALGEANYYQLKNLLQEQWI